MPTPVSHFQAPPPDPRTRIPGPPPPRPLRRPPARRPPRWPFAALVALAALLLVGVVIVFANADDGGGPRYRIDPAAQSAAVPDRWRELARQMAAPWPDLQMPNGRFPDYTDRYIKGYPLTRYGEAVLGYALVQTGVREGDERLVESGLEALAYVANRPPGTHHRASVFEDMAMAAAYNLVRRRLPRHPIFVRNRSAWESFLRKIRPVSTPYRRPETSRYSNHYLVEAIGVLELLRSGLRSARPGATIGGKRALAKRVTYRLLNEQVPSFATRDRVRVRGENTFILSDPPDNPLAYQGFSIGFFGRALRVLGQDDSPFARSAIRGAVNASVWLTAPDGDSAYFGRSQEQAWALAATAAGAEAASRLDGSGKSRDRRYRALAERALARLRDAYGVGEQGLFIVPGLRLHMRLGSRGLDPNAGAPSFAGITLMALNWALDEIPGRGYSQSRIGADGNMAVRMSRGESRFAVVRRGGVWFAVRQTRSERKPTDLRYDMGLIAMKAVVRGRWRDVLRLRPRRVFARDSAGPVLRSGGVVGLPFGRSLRVNRRGVVTIKGGYRTPGGRVLRDGQTFTYRPTRCGVRLEWFAQPGDRFEYSVFSRRANVRARGSTLADVDQRVRFNVEPRVRLRAGYASATDPILIRARAQLATDRPRVIRVTICAPRRS